MPVSHEGPQGCAFVSSAFGPTKPLSARGTERKLEEKLLLREGSPVEDSLSTRANFPAAPGGAGNLGARRIVQMDANNKLWGVGDFAPTKGLCGLPVSADRLVGTPT
jgi:hypothetical protein